VLVPLFVTAVWIVESRVRGIQRQCAASLQCWEDGSDAGAVTENSDCMVIGVCVTELRYVCVR
jgi:hypothetical protein